MVKFGTAKGDLGEARGEKLWQGVLIGEEGKAHTGEKISSWADAAQR